MLSPVGFASIVDVIEGEGRVAAAGAVGFGFLPRVLGGIQSCESSVCGGGE